MRKLIAMARHFWRVSCLILVVSLAGCATLLGLQKFDTPEQRAWEEASLKMVVKWRDLPEGLSDIEKVEAIIAVGDAYIKNYYPEQVGYLAVMETLSAEYTANYIAQDGNFRPRLRLIYSLVIEYLRAQETDEPVSYNGLEWNELERKAHREIERRASMTAGASIILPD